MHECLDVTVLWQSMVGAGASLFVALNFEGILSLDNVNITSAGEQDAALMAMGSGSHLIFC